MKATITEVKNITKIHNVKYAELQKRYPELMELALDGVVLRKLLRNEVIEALKHKKGK